MDIVRTVRPALSSSASPLLMDQLLLLEPYTTLHVYCRFSMHASDPFWHTALRWAAIICPLVSRIALLGPELFHWGLGTRTKSPPRAGHASTASQSNHQPNVDVAWMLAPLTN